MRRMVFLLEERSAMRMLEGLIPRLIANADLDVQFHPFEGKSDLERNIIKKIRYWCSPDPTCFVIMRDQDSGDCAAIVERLQALCREAGRPDTLVRIACRELESWYLGDLEAVQKGLGLPNLARLQQKKLYRNPDRLGSPSRELSRITGNRYQKVDGSHRIGPYLKLEGNTSYSFGKFLDGIRRCRDFLLTRHSCMCD